MKWSFAYIHVTMGREWLCIFIQHNICSWHWTASTSEKKLTVMGPSAWHILSRSLKNYRTQWPAVGFGSYHQGTKGRIWNLRSNDDSHWECLVPFDDHNITYLKSGSEGARFESRICVETPKILSDDFNGFPRYLHVDTGILVYIIILLLILTGNGFMAGDSGTTLRHSTQITTQDNIPHTNKTRHTTHHEYNANTFLLMHISNLH
jgi:hypothetical protein